MKTKEIRKGAYPQAPSLEEVMEKDGTPRDGYETIQVEQLPSEELALNEYLRNNDLEEQLAFLHTRTEPLQDGIEHGNRVGFKTIEWGKTVTPSRIEHEQGECFIVRPSNFQHPSIVIDEDQRGCRLFLSGFEVEQIKGQSSAYCKWVDKSGRPGADVNLSLPFRSRENALRFLCWLRQDFETRLKQTISRMMPSLTEWSAAWTLDTKSQLSDASIVERKQHRRPGNAGALESKQSSVRSLFSGLFGKSK